MRIFPRIAAALLIAVLLRLPPALHGQVPAVRDDSATYTSRSIRMKLDSFDEKSGFLLSPEVVVDKEGSLRLAHSLLLTEETGATDYRQSEQLSERVWAKKVFQLEDSEIKSAEVFFFGSAKEVRFNGHRLKCERLVSTGWMRARVPAELLHPEANEIVFSSEGSLLIEPGRPGHSYKSGDGGANWSNRTLGSKNSLQGEYLVRLRLERYAPHGWAMSSVLDLWEPTGTEVAQPWQIASFTGMTKLNKDQPVGTRVTAWLRTGSTPLLDERNWTDWRRLDRDVKTEASTENHRWGQLKFELETTRGQATPRLRAVSFEFSTGAREANSSAHGTLKLLRPRAGQQQAPRLSSVPFVYESASPRLKLLREKYQLDKVTAPGKTEMEQLMLLRYWVRNQCHRGWASHPALWIPPWDTLLILESRDRPDCLVMCTHFSCMFTQCCLALGWNARHCILDHHCVSEVWVDQHHKWVMMDTGNSAERADVGLHFERGGVPLSARELQLIHRSGKSEGVQVCFTPERLMKQIAPLCRPAPPAKNKPLARPDTIPLAELKKYPVCQIDNFRRYAFPPRNNYLSTLYPGELEHGFSEYFYDGYCWVGDSADDTRISPEYSRHLSPERPQDIDWDINWVRIHLSQTAKPGEIQIDVEPHVPNLARLEKATPQGAKEKPVWQPATERFVWQLKPGTNTLEVRGVNAWERAGRASHVQVEWKPAK